MDQFKREPAIPKKLGEIDPQKDKNVRVFGTIVKVGTDSVVLDDGSQAKEIYVGHENIEGLKLKDKIRIFGKVLPSIDNYEIQADIIQNLNDLNLSVYSRVKEKYGIQI